jgi:multicomponent Na+:H+ antiporter subunit F
VSVLVLPLLLAAFLCLYRIGKGPTAADRMVAIDILGLIVVAVCALIALFLDQSFFMDITLTFALLSFVGSLALAKYLEGRSLDD